MKRISRSIPQKKMFFIFCNGETEHNYFTERKSVVRGENIKIIPCLANEGSPKKFIKYILRFLKTNYDTPKEGDKIFCLIDTDAVSDQSIVESLRIKPNYIDLILSNPNFELWLLLHFELCRHTLLSAETITRLKRYVEDYEKPEIEPFFSRLRENELRAIDHAQHLREFHRDSGIDLFSTNANPHTFVDIIITNFRR